MQICDAELEGSKRPKTPDCNLKILLLHNTTAELQNSSSTPHCKLSVWHNG